MRIEPNYNVKPSKNKGKNNRSGNILIINN